MHLPAPPAFVPDDYIVTAVSGNKVSRRAVIYGAESVVLGGKCVIHAGAIIRGDLRRSPRAPAANAVMILGRYNVIRAGVVVRPPYRLTQGCVGAHRQLGYLTLRMGDYCYMGDGAIVEGAQIGSRVFIGSGAVVVRVH